MMDDAAEQHAVEACVGKRQVLDVAFEELDVRVFPAAELDQLRADIEPGAAASVLPQDRAEHARAAAEVGHAGARGKPPQP